MTKGNGADCVTKFKEKYTYPYIPMHIHVYIYFPCSSVREVLSDRESQF